MSDRIPGGYVLKPRKIKNSDISDASPCTRETWDYLIREANHKPFKRGKFKLDRGQLFRSYDEILDALCWYVGWRKERYTKNQMKQAMKFLRDTERITTSKKPGGVLITICNYSTYQDPSNYERTKEETNEETIEKPLRNQEETSHNYKNDNNVKNEEEINIPFADFWDSYDKKKGSKKKCRKKWSRLSDDERNLIMDHIDSYKQSFSEKQYQPYPHTFLNGKNWEAESYTKGNSKKQEKIDFGI